MSSVTSLYFFNSFLVGIILWRTLKENCLSWLSLDDSYISLKLLFQYSIQYSTRARHLNPLGWTGVTKFNPFKFPHFYNQPVTVTFTIFLFLSTTELCDKFSFYHFKYCNRLFPFLVSFSVAPEEGEFCLTEILGIKIYLSCSISLSFIFILYWTLLILIFTKIRLHFATVCASGPFFTVYTVFHSILCIEQAMLCLDVEVWDRSKSKLRVGSGPSKITNLTDLAASIFQRLRCV